MVSLDQQSIRRGHRELLSTFREFVQPITSPDGAPAPDELRGAVAFLRQGIMTFARREEACPAPGDGSSEDMSREHAFIAAEIDQLACEVSALMMTAADAGSEREARLTRIQRLAYRIEAALEVHLLRDEERVLESAEAPTPGSGRSANEMSVAEVSEFLQTHRWGVLCTVGAGRPYAVPVSYTVDGEHIYFATGSGRKAENLEACPAVCLVVPDVIDGDHWRSVVASGDAYRVNDLRESLRALRRLGGEK
jgi:hypothetical protein